MRPALLLTWICLIFASSLALADDRSELCGDKARIRDILGDAREVVAEMRGMAAAQSDYIARREMTRKADKLKRLMERLRAELKVADMEPSPAPVAEQVAPMPADRFEALLKALGAEAFSKGKIRVVRQAAGHNHFSVAQVKRVMRQFSFADGKVQAAAAMHPKLIDPENFFEAYKELSFEADKNKLREAVEK